MEKVKSSGQTSPVKAIRAYCLNCCLESATEVRLCAAKDCDLWPFRFGKNPYNKKTYSEEQLEAYRQRGRKSVQKINENRGDTA